MATVCELSLSISMSISSLVTELLPEPIHEQSTTCVQFVLTLLVEGAEEEL